MTEDQRAVAAILRGAHTEAHKYASDDRNTSTADGVFAIEDIARQLAEHWASDPGFNRAAFMAASIDVAGIGNAWDKP